MTPSHKEILKKDYTKPSLCRIALDNQVSLYLMSEGGIPDPPPWETKAESHTDPYKSNEA